ncbi:MAG: chemotaxis protein CheW [Thermodesulfobacteriota bacterium]
MSQLVTSVNQAIKEITNREGKYLTFSLGAEEYGIGILKIKEIIGMLPITAVPRTPPFVKGVINLRGKVIPVIDLRVKFGMEDKAYTEKTCIIVVEIKGKDNPILMGIVVDAVSEVLNIKAGEIEETPRLGTNLDLDYISGIAKINGGVKILLDIDKVLNQEGINFLTQKSHSG